MQHNNLFVFDIETVPDTEAAKRLLNIDGSDEFLKEKLVEYHLEVTGGRNSFLRQPFHKVACISFLEAEIQYTNEGEIYHLKALRSGGHINSSEEEMLQGFFHHLSTSNPRIVSFNGRTFDIPVLKYRAMMYKIQAKWFYSVGDKWNSYHSRYSLNWHCDLLDALSDFGTSARVKVNEVAALLGIPGKLSVDGSMVDQMYAEGKLQEIRDYCELDVLSTYLIYLYYALHKGIMTRSAYKKAMDDIENFLAENDNKQHFFEFLSEWRTLKENEV